ncbi:MAG: 50S ribosomal protein L4 [Endomicrobium sp.]|jgi:large subunit ribosomal protein L4|nr:50S ribosomal protein L4 [Endomicrobium sp.]
METVVYNSKGQENGKIELPTFFNAEVSSVLLHEITTAYLSNQRSGTHKTKTRGEVSFSGAKPWRQKGTGNARAGQKNSPLWRKGGVVFGPQPRNYYIKMSKQKKKLSLNMALSVQFKNGNIIVVDSLNIHEAKTKKAMELMRNLKVDGKKVIFAVSKNTDANFKVAVRNIENVILKNIENINAYEVLWTDKLIITPDAIDMINKRQSGVI